MQRRFRSCGGQDVGAVGRLGISKGASFLSCTSICYWTIGAVRYGCPHTGTTDGMSELPEHLLFVTLKRRRHYQNEVLKHLPTHILAK